MANKRMFTMNICDSDAFLDMPLSAQCLYFHLNMRADDDGFISNPKRVSRLIGASEDDLKLLILKKFVLCFDSGVIVIKHWRMHNTLSAGRYTETVYKEEKAQLYLKENKAYSLTSGTPIDDTRKIEIGKRQVSRQTIDEQKTNTDKDIDKDIDIDKDKIKSKSNKFVAPTYNEVAAYCNERHNNVDANRFIDYYTSNGWMVGKNKMKDWKAAVRNWERGNNNTSSSGSSGGDKFMQDLKRIGAEIYGKSETDY